MIRDLEGAIRTMDALAEAISGSDGPAAFVIPGS
jgi:hypothetical protein